jgi:kanamycin kinase
VPPTPPPALVALAPEWTASLAYQLLADVTTWRLVHADGRVRFAKVDRAGRHPNLRGEAERMIWAAAYLSVPEVVEVTERDGSTILITESLPGRDGTDPVWRDDLRALVRALGRGLAAFHHAVGEEWCPFRFDVERALDHVAQRVAAGGIEAEGFHHEHQHLTPTAALEQLRATAPTSEDLVVCHGDYCPPNSLLIEGEVTGYVDLGELGVADRWRDIAIGGWSAVWNFGPQYEALFYESYGVEPDPERIAFYRLLWEMSS